MLSEDPEEHCRCSNSGLLRLMGDDFEGSESRE